MLPETTYVPTDDGWRLALHHFPPRGERRRHPVLMVHGLGANRLNIDLDERYSLARAARSRGYDTFLLELRGAGLSISPGGQDRTQFQWGFGEYAQIDLPAAVKAVLEITGAPRLHGLGHSMGGMLWYALATGQPAELRSICTLASPLIAELDLGARERRLLGLARRLTPPGSPRRVPIKRVMEVAGRFVSVGSKLVDGILLNAANTEPEVMARMAREAIADIPLKLVLEITEQMSNVRASEGPYAYEQHLHRIDVPIYAMAGSGDRVAPPSSVKAVVQRLAAPFVRHREMGRRFGDSADYGHADILVGRPAPEEVFPLVLDFFDEVD
jgi:pimeloyl-ACP methyl ester carboxylesterase